MPERHHGVDLLKVILAFGVVALHVFPLAGLAGAQGVVSYEITNGIARVAVPSFFLVTGYFIGGRLSDRTYILRYERRILLLYLVWQVVYLPVPLHDLWAGEIRPRTIVHDLIFGYWHLWYLIATAGAVVLLVVARGARARAKLAAALVLFVAGYALQLVNNLGVCADRGAFHYFYMAIGTPRNAIFLGFPLMVIGSTYEYWRPRTEPRIYLIGIALAGLLAEAFVYSRLLSGSMDFYLTIIPLCMLVFDLAMRSAVEVRLPRSLSIGVYLCHPYAVLLMNRVFRDASLSGAMARYVAVCGLAVLAWFAIDRLDRRWPVFF